MRTLFIDTEDFGRVAVIHNSDWSGEAEVNWETNEGARVFIPAQLLVILGRQAAQEEVKAAVIAALEQL